MTEDDIAVKVKGVYKSFRLPNEQSSGIKQAIINRFKGKKGYEVQHVLNDISFEIKKGEFFGIVGRNGSGKSTLLKLLANIYVPDKGTLSITGSLTPFIELGVGFNPELTGRDNVYLNGALLGFSRKEMDEKYDAIVSFAELGRFMDQKLKNYSSGMQVRLAFSIATHADSDVLIFDEVLAVGDARFQQKCLDVFRNLKKEGKTIILVSHSTGDVEKFCDRVLVVDKSRSLGVFPAREAIALYEKLNIDNGENNSVTVQPKRWGSEKLRIENVRVSQPSVLVNESLSVSLDVTRNEKFKGQEIPFVAGLAFYDDDGVNLTGPNTMDNGYAFGAKKKVVTVTYSIDKIKFHEGRYSITAAILDENGERSLDHILDAASFTIISDQQFHGKIVLDDARWELL